MTVPDRLPANPARNPRIAAIGLASWDRTLVLDRYPAAGESVVILDSFEGPGGTTTNAAVTLARLGAQVTIRAHVGDDIEGAAIRAALEVEGVDTGMLTTAPGVATDLAILTITPDPVERTIFWKKGARLARGDRFDIPALYGHDVVLLDVDDPALLRFLVDLPVHTFPGARLFGTMSYLEDIPSAEALPILLRHDVVAGSRRQLQTITGTSDLDDAVATLRNGMWRENLRAALITDGARGAIAITRDELHEHPGFRVDAVDPTGAGDAFAGAAVFGTALRWDWPLVLAFANAVAALSTTAMGAQTALPSWDQTLDFMRTASLTRP